MNSLSLSHGHAIAIGMLMEAFISINHASLRQSEYSSIKKFITSNYKIPHFTNEDIDSMVRMIENDKKNREGKIFICLISEIGVYKYDIEVDKDVLISTFQAFQGN